MSDVSPCVSRGVFVCERKRLVGCWAGSEEREGEREREAEKTEKPPDPPPAAPAAHRQKESGTTHAHRHRLAPTHAERGTDGRTPGGWAGGAVVGSSDFGDGAPG